MRSLNKSRALRLAGQEPGAEVAVVGARWADHVDRALEFLRRRTLGDYEIDDFGFDPDLTDSVLLAALRPLYRHWFRVEVHGIENIPADGGAVVISFRVTYYRDTSGS